MLPTNRPPSTPGEILLEEFLKPMEMTQVAFAAKIGVPSQRVNPLIKGRRAVTADTAWKLAAVFKTSPQLWMNLQTNYDLWLARQQQRKKRAAVGVALPRSRRRFARACAGRRTTRGGPHARRRCATQWRNESGRVMVGPRQPASRGATSLVSLAATRSSPCPRSP